MLDVDHLFFGIKISEALNRIIFSIELDLVKRGNRYRCA